MKLFLVIFRLRLFGSDLKEMNRFRLNIMVIKNSNKNLDKV